MTPRPGHVVAQVVLDRCCVTPDEVCNGWAIFEAIEGLPRRPSVVPRRSDLAAATRSPRCAGERPGGVRTIRFLSQAYGRIDP